MKYALVLQLGLSHKLGEWISAEKNDELDTRTLFFIIPLPTPVCLQKFSLNFLK